MTHVRIWKFRPPRDRESEFEAAYSGNGSWAELFNRSTSFRGTSLLRPQAAGGWWLTIDRWDSFAAFEAFQDQFADEYRALDVELEGIAGEEEFVGAFES